VNFRRSVIIAEFYGNRKTTPYGKIFKILFRQFSSRHRSTCCVKISWNLADEKNLWSSALFLPDKKNKILPGSPAVATARIAPKVCQDQPPIMYWECSRFHPNRFNLCGVIAERVNTTKTRRKVNPIFGWSHRRAVCLIVYVFVYHNMVNKAE